ncbi:MAG: chemotaxis-specific protein-glutamate methyltransferase CheB [Chloroflexota bacterium]|nr:MAG: chemotaxis-specific protein-glutamate methyltransferase CheB [Chloroflexota bacterium]
MPTIRVLVVEDSITVRKRMCEVFSADPDIIVMAEAQDGKRAIELCRELRPDVVTMDMMLPVMTGLAATEYIMAHCPTPILVVSSSLNRGELFRTYEALAAGAVDVLEKPDADDSDGEWEGRLVSAVKMLSRIKVITHPRARLRAFEQPHGYHATGEVHQMPAGRRCQIIAIGASTGGPAAIVEILRALPDELRIPILLVLHISEPFGAAFADWLDGQTKHRVSYARDGESVSSAAGRVIMAPPDRHLVVEAGRLRLTQDPERYSCRPSVDVLFESVAREFGATATACLLTGMGRDGASGLLALRTADAITIAQDEATCIVYGMPREAVLLGAAQRVLPLGEIGPTLASLAGVSPP